jgi:hypothetical protein
LLGGTNFQERENMMSTNTLITYRGRLRSLTLVPEAFTSYAVFTSGQHRIELKFRTSNPEGKFGPLPRMADYDVTGYFRPKPANRRDPQYSDDYFMVEDITLVSTQARSWAFENNVDALARWDSSDHARYLDFM